MGEICKQQRGVSPSAARPGLVAGAVSEYRAYALLVHSNGLDPYPNLDWSRCTTWTNPINKGLESRGSGSGYSNEPLIQWEAEAEAEAEAEPELEPEPGPGMAGCCGRGKGRPGRVSGSGSGYSNET